MPTIVFVQPDGTRVDCAATAGQTVLDVAHQYDIDLEGACEGSLACSTCHVVVDEAWFDKLPDATEDEEDMLDLAFGLARTSRLGCQISITDALDGLTLNLAGGSRNVLEG